MFDRTSKNVTVSTGAFYSWKNDFRKQTIFFVEMSMSCRGTLVLKIINGHYRERIGVMNIHVEF